MLTEFLKKLPALAILAAASTVALAADKEVNIAYQTSVEPSKVAQADGNYEKSTGWKINWRKFESGGDVITAVASGDFQIGYVGSSPLAAAATRELPIETIFIAAEIGEAEALVVRNGSGITKAQDLIGKKVAVPFVSTTHYSLLAALKHWGIDLKKVQIINLRPTEIAAAWQRGDIDAAYVWDPALGKAKETGKVLTSSAEVAKWGAPTFDAWIVRKDFAKKNPDFVTAFVRITGKAYADYRANGKSWTADSPQAEKIARLTGANKKEIPELLLGSVFPTLEEQTSARLLSGDTVKAISDTSAFLKEQKKAERVLVDYKPFVNPQFAKQAKAVIMIRLQSVGVTFPGNGGQSDVEVLRNLSLDLTDGRFTVVIGESGCGKTTLLNLIAGFIQPTQGTLTIDGKPIRAPGPDRAVVFQDDALLPWQTVLQNIAFGLQLAGVPTAEREATARDYLMLTGLTAYADYPIWKISGGMRQRAGLARALAINPRFLLLDEPLGALDALTRERMQEHLLHVWQTAKKGVLMITHSVEEALFLATDLVVMRARPGRIEEIHQLDFSRRFAAGEPARSIKSDRTFVALREQILADLMLREGEPA